MNVIETPLSDLLIIEPRVFSDDRGHFFESYNQEKFTDQALNYSFVQDNQSCSGYGVIRGLHFQKPPHAQTKLVRALEGAIFDVAVDIRKGSPTYGQWFGVELTADNFKQLLVPKGFAHGFSVLSEKATVLYKCDDFYHPETEGSIDLFDTDLNIDWKIQPGKAMLSGKDQASLSFKNLDSQFSIQ